MTASKVILAFCVTRLEMKTIIIGATETFYVFARLMMSVNQTKSFAIVQTVHLHNFSLCRVFHHFLKIILFGGRDGLFYKIPRRKSKCVANVL